MSVMPPEGGDCFSMRCAAELATQVKKVWEYNLFSKKRPFLVGEATRRRGHFLVLKRFITCAAELAMQVKGLGI